MYKSFISLSDTKKEKHHENFKNKIKNGTSVLAVRHSFAPSG